MSDTMKILFYISTIRGGGAARVMVNIANGLLEKGYDICFVTNFPADHEYKLSDKIKRISLEKTEYRGNVIFKNIGRIIGLRKIIKKEKPVVSVAFMGENNFRLIVASAGLPTKTVVSVRNDPNREYSRKGTKELANLLYSKADGVVFQTKDAQAFFKQKIQKKSKIIFNQVDEKFFNENYEIGEYIVACGRLSKQKNYPVMLKAFAEVLKERPHEQLRIYGEGELKDELIMLTRNLGISESVHFMGFSMSMNEVYKNAKLLVMTSDYEGMPNAVLEALASSVPVVSTDCPCGGPKMVIRDEINGYLVPVGDIYAVAIGLKSALSGIEKHKLMKQKAFDSASIFTKDKILIEWENFIIKQL